MTHTAQIHNLELVRTASERLVSRTSGLPGLAALYGPAGYGKTTAAGAVANENRSYFVQIRSAWSRKALLEKVLVEMSIKASGTISDMLDQVAAQLAASGRMLILDEFDYADRLYVVAECPATMQEQARSECKRLALGAAPTQNPLSMRIWKICQTCPHKPEKES